MGFVKIVLATEMQKMSEKHEWKSKYPQVFSGLGKLPKQYHITVAEKVTIIIQVNRWLGKKAIALGDKIKATLVQAVKDKVMEKVDEPSEWVSQMVAVEKPNGKIRICLDPKKLNEAIKREHFPLPTVEDITTRLAGATFFRKMTPIKAIGK